MEELTLAEILKTVADLGLTGGLIVGLWLFIKGKLWPESMVERVMEQQRKQFEQSATILAKEVCEKISEGVAEGMERGISKGLIKFNNGG